MGVRDWQYRRNASRPVVLGISAVALVHLLAKNVAATLLSVSLCGSPSGGRNLVDQFLLERLESVPQMNPSTVRDVPELGSDFTLQ